MTAVLVVALVCATLVWRTERRCRHEKELEVMEGAHSIALAKRSADADALAAKLDTLTKRVNELATPDRMLLVENMAKKFRAGLGV